MPPEADTFKVFSSAFEEKPPGALMMCRPHDTELREMLAAEQLGGEIPYVAGCSAIYRLGINTLGSETILQYGSGCPVCAFKAFPFIRGIVDALLPPKRPG